MTREKKRLFVGNLPPSCTEEHLVKKFKKYGSALSVELKRRADGSTFAFLDLEINNKDLESCINKVCGNSWDGHEIKIELAKESFLSRLERERALAQNNSVVISTKTNHPKVEITSPFKKENKMTVKMKKHSVISSRKKVAKSDDDEDDDRKGNIPMFKGILNVPGDEFNHDTLQDGSKMLHTEETGERDMLQTFESFSDVWKDNPKDHLDHNNYNDSRPSYHSDMKMDGHRQTKEVDSHQRSIDAEERRLKSIAERKKLYLQQKQAVRSALLKIDSNARNNKKIIFDGEENENDNKSVFQETKSKKKFSTSPERSSNDKKGQLFSDEEMEEESNDFKIKSQFEGQKGQKLLALQARYANDKRFTLDERFYESDDSTEEITSKPNDLLDEKNNQLRILGNILGQELIAPGDQSVKQKKKTMLRFDPTKPDHVKYEVKKPAALESEGNVNEPTSRKRKREKATDKTEDPPEVSKEKYYEVSDALKESWKNENQKFSFLNMFGPNDSGEKGEDDQDEVQTEKGRKKQIGWSLNPFKYDSSDSEEEQDQKPVPVNNFTSDSKETWHESFFFTPNDTRLKEGLEFLKHREESDDNFTVKRKELKHIVRFKVKNNQKKALKWKKKLGGKRQSKIHGKIKRPRYK